MNALLAAARSTEFLTGLTWGGVALGAGLVLSLVWRRLIHKPAPIVGLLLTAAAWWAMPTVRETPNALWQGLVLLAAAGLLFPWARRLPLLPAILAAPGAWWITQRTGLPGTTWAAWLLFAMIVIGAPMAASFDRTYRDRAFGPIVFAVTIASAFSTLPDTEEILVLFGVMIPLVLLAWPKVLASLGGIGVYPAIGLLAWVVAWGGRGRDTAIVGAVAGLGLLVAEPVARWPRGTPPLRHLPDGPAGSVIAGILQGVVVLGTARLAGIQTDLTMSIAIAAGVLSVATGALAALPAPSRRKH